MGRFPARIGACSEVPRHATAGKGSKHEPFCGGLFHPITSFMGLLFLPKDATLIFMDNPLARPRNRRPDPGPGRRRRRGRDPALRRVLHRQHPQPQHPRTPTPGRSPTSSAGASCAACASSAASSRCTSPPTSSSSAKPTRRPRSSSTSPRCACCSTGWWSARWSAATPPRWCAGPSHVVNRGQTPMLSPEEARALFESIPTDSLVGLARSGADRRPDLQLRAHQRGARDAGRGLLPPGQALVAPAAREGRQAPRDAGAPYASRRTSTPTSSAAGIGEDKKGPLFRAALAKRPALGASHACAGGALEMIYRRGKAGRDRDPDRLPHLPGDRDHHLPHQRRHPREGADDGRALQPAHHQALRPHERCGEPG